MDAKNEKTEPCNIALLRAASVIGHGPESCDLDPFKNRGRTYDLDHHDEQAQVQVRARTVHPLEQHLCPIMPGGKKT